MSKQLCQNFFKFCPNFRQIKNFGGALTPGSLHWEMDISVWVIKATFKSLFDVDKSSL